MKQFLTNVITSESAFIKELGVDARSGMTLDG
jgi:hypothetical protein